jgi:hypothetical protein
LAAFDVAFQKGAVRELMRQCLLLARSGPQKHSMSDIGVTPDVA